MKGERIVISTMCRDSILADLHKSHEGANRSLSLARTCVYWPGMEADIMDYIKWCVTYINNAKMPVEMLHPHKVPIGPRVKLDMDFFQDDSRNKFLIVADYFSKFPFIFPVISTHCITRHWDIWEISSQPKAYPLLWWLTMDHPPMVKNSSTSLESSTSSTRHPHHISTNRMDSSRPWWRKWKLPTKKTDGSPNAQARALLQLHDIPLAKDLPSPAEILHGQSRTRSCHAPTSQTYQHTENMLMTSRNPEHAKGTFRSSSQSQRRMSPQGERTSKVLPK